MIGDYSNYELDANTFDNLEKAEREIVNYIFFKTRSTWDVSQFEKNFGVGEDLAMIKRDWAPDLLEALKTRYRKGEPVEKYILRCKNKIDSVFREIRYRKANDLRLSYVSMRLVCSEIANYISPEALSNEILNSALPAPKKIYDPEKAFNTGAAVLANVLAKLRGKQSVRNRIDPD